MLQLAAGPFSGEGDESGGADIKIIGACYRIRDPGAAVMEQQHGKVITKQIVILMRRSGSANSVNLGAALFDPAGLVQYNTADNPRPQVVNHRSRPWRRQSDC